MSHVIVIYRNGILIGALTLQNTCSKHAQKKILIFNRLYKKPPKISLLISKSAVEMKKKYIAWNA